MKSIWRLILISCLFYSFYVTEQLHILLNLYLSFVGKSNVFRVILDRIVLFIVAVLNIAMLTLRQFFMNI